MNCCSAPFRRMLDLSRETIPLKLNKSSHKLFYHDGFLASNDQWLPLQAGAEKLKTGPNFVSTNLENDNYLHRIVNFLWLWAFLEGLLYSKYLGSSSG